MLPVIFRRFTKNQYKETLDELYCIFCELMIHFSIFLSQAPLVQKNEVQNLEVEVRGNTFYSKEVRRVMIKIFQLTFIQTDKPMYLPGQTGNFEETSNDTSAFCLSSLKYNIHCSLPAFIPEHPIKLIINKLIKKQH